MDINIDLKDTATSADFWYEVVMHLKVKDT